MSGLFLHDVEVGGARVDVRCDTGHVRAVGPRLAPGPGDRVVDGDGAALIPGLHDHHIHLLAAAAALHSVQVGPPGVHSPDDFAAVLAGADAHLCPGAWLRGVGYHESVAGHLDRDAIDAVVAHRPVRIQHRSGALWMFNSKACEVLGLATAGAAAETDGRGRCTGRLFRGDAWLATKTVTEGPPDLAGLGRLLAGYGVTGVTDATSSSDGGWLDVLASAAMPQRITAMGGLALSQHPFPPQVLAGPVKIVLNEADLPGADALAGEIALAHERGRAVAIHIVSRESLVLGLVAWEMAGARSGDRIEHGSVIPLELTGRLAALGLTVVTQPNFVAERGGDYRRDVDRVDQADLYRCASLRRAGVRIAGGTDAPFGRPDPWRAIDAAIHRRFPGGELNASEALTPERALGLFLGPPEDPGGGSRRVAPGAPADLVLLWAPLDDTLCDASASSVRTTIIGGVPVAATEP